MLAEERQNQILSLVKLNRSISITEIQQRLAVSRETIRRDLLTLAEQRKIRKTHGGAISLDTQEPEMAVRQTTNVVGKRAIIPRGVRIGRNVKVAGDTKANNFPSRIVKSGSSIESDRPRTPAARNAAVNAASSRAEKRSIPVEPSSSGHVDATAAIAGVRSPSRAGSGSDS